MINGDAKVTATCHTVGIPIMAVPQLDIGDMMKAGVDAKGAVCFDEVSVFKIAKYSPL